jgi:hypothetical protein
MTQKKQPLEENSDRIERLKKIYFEWKERKLANELFEPEEYIKEYIVADPDDLDLEERW